MGLFLLPPNGILSRRRDLRWHLTMLREQFPHDVRDGLPTELDAEALLDKSDWELSGGEARRAEMALAWTRRPVCLLADEPLAGLAPLDQERVAKVIRRMADEGCAVVVSGHDVRRLLDLSDQVIWLAAGTTHGLGTTEDARNHHQFRKEYLGPAV
jgi:ABC-type lipopolysaccharide export system ATPase subunit